MFQFVMVTLLSFGPAIALQIWSEGDYPWLVGTLALLGCFYFPMAFLAVAMFDHCDVPLAFVALTRYW